MAAGVGLALFIRSQVKAASPLVRLSLFCNLVLTVGFAMSAMMCDPILIL